jgi:ribosomal protein L37AE/L43A
MTTYPTVCPEDVEIPCVVDTNVARCDRCKAYINPFVTFMSSGKWRCNMCGVENEGKNVAKEMLLSYLQFKAKLCISFASTSVV